MKIFEYDVLDKTGLTVVSNAAGLTPLSVGVQRGRPVMWCEVGRHGRQALRIEVLTVMTGQDFCIDHTWKFLGTLLLDEGSFVLHVYTREA